MFPPPAHCLEMLAKVPTSPPDKYEIVGKIAHGGYGEINKAIIKKNKDAGFFALKTNRHEGYAGVVTTIDYNEVKSLTKLNKEKNVVRFIECVRDEKQFTLVLEYCRVDLSKVLYGNVPLSIGGIKNMLQQIFTGIKGIHRNNLMHRDIKPANILLSLDGTLKITDFGNAVEMGILPKLSTNVCTIWYKSPELCFGHGNYNQKIDIWSAGCMAVEFWTRKPALFNGNDDVTQMEKISELCGFCSESVWPGAKEFPNYDSLHAAFGKYTENKLQKHLLDVTHHAGAANFLARMIKLNAAQRMTADEALKDVFFESAPGPTSDLSWLLKCLDMRGIK